MASAAGPSTSAPPAPLPTRGTVLPAGASGVTPTLQNVVATVNLGTRLDLKAIALHARNAEYNPKVRGREREREGAGRGGGGPPPPTLPARPFFLSPPPLPPLQRFAAVIMRIRDPKTTALIFASGKMVR